MFTVPCVLCNINYFTVTDKVFVVTAVPPTTTHEDQEDTSIFDSDSKSKALHAHRDHTTHYLTHTHTHMMRVCA